MEKTTTHPLALKKTELIWEGKYDAEGRRVAPLRVALPFQTVETVNESVQERQKNLLFASSASPRETEWRNRLIWGDKKYVLPSLLAEYAGKVNLIYIDPPFDTGSDFSFTATVPDHPSTTADDPVAFTKQPSIIEQKAYRDTWGRGLDSYLQWFYETVVLLHELLHETGTIYVHLDWHIGHYAKSILDQVFGGELLLNEVIWYYANKLPTGGNIFDRHHDLIYWYAKTKVHTFNEIRVESEYKGTQLQTKKVGGKRVPIIDPKTGKQVRVMSSDKPCGDMWRINMIHAQSEERVNYPTQKPEALLDRIIRASTNEDDLILDCFCGSGTTASVAEKLGRRWITSDLGRFAIHTTRKRLLSIQSVRPFVVQNLGKYERQLWQTEEFTSVGNPRSGTEANQQRAYVDFILKLYQANPIHGYTWLHGLKGGRLIHVGAVDAPVSAGDIPSIAAEFRKAVGSGKDAPTTNGVDVLGWDFAFEMNEVARQQAAAANIKMRFLRIPRDVMDKRAVEQGDIHFFELAALSVNAKAQKRKVVLSLTDFVIPPDDVPEEVRREIKHWSQWIDYWAVDWNNKGDAFHNEWQTYRTRKDAELSLETEHIFAEAGEYTAVIKVIDILGNDTTKSVKLKVK